MSFTIDVTPQAPDIVVDVSPNQALVEVVQPAPILLTVEPMGRQGPRGVDGEGAWTIGTVVETSDGTRETFSIAGGYDSGSMVVFLNGLFEPNVTEASATTITFSEAPLSGDTISLLYRAG